MAERTRYRFVGTYVSLTTGRRRYVWQGPRLAGDSRVEQIECDAEWFWGAR